MLLSFPLTIALGLVFLSLTLTMVGPALGDHFGNLKSPMLQVVQAWRG
jgi:flagellar biosynthesis protein FliR